MFRGLGVRLADFISFSLNIHGKEIIWSHCGQIIPFSLDI